VTVIPKSAVVVIVVILIVGAACFAIYSLKPRLVSLQEATRQSRQILEQAGGSEEVCREAQRLFLQFGTAELKVFHPDELKEYPALKMVGKVDGIWPGDPPYIKIRVGNHIKGFQIDLVASRLDSASTGLAGAEHFENCIYLQR
jgi:hypothetical protein